ncbi:MAG TPA: hypothetical protein VJT73_15960 [Polyangiaceae bacterium]|nr:hypothetical protein [Polyangiaceae bacterium]
MMTPAPPPSTYLVFSQDSADAPHVDRLAAHAARFFDAKIELVARATPTYPETPARVRVRLTCTRPPFARELSLTVRVATRGDLADARDAEARGRAAGMGALAERCPRVWEIADDGGGEGSAEQALLTMSAICASVALGPVLPPDHGTLFGVRGAIERRERAPG